MPNEVFFDVETKRLFDPDYAPKPENLGVSIVSVYSRIVDNDLKEIEGTMQSFWESELAALWEIFQKADRVIGFNSKKFDIWVLQPLSPIPLSKLNHFDIMEKVKEAFGRRVSLDAIVKGTLGLTKTDFGPRAVEYYQRGDKESLAKLQKYCESDVLLTRDIYDYVVKNGELKFKDHWNTPRVIQLDFSYPKENFSKQMGLF